jgi:hypothetical protein
MGHEHKYMGHETANWGGRRIGYMLFNAHLCNQPCYCQVVVEPGAQICTLLEVWVHDETNVSLGIKHIYEQFN